MDRFIVKDSITKDSVWWSNINQSFDEDKFDALHKKIIAYFSGKELYVRDTFACANPKYKMNIRVVNEYAWSNLFAYNMFLRPTEKEIENFKPEWTILNAPGFMADAKIDGTRQHNFAILSFSKKIIIIGGTGYTGEIKKSIFSALTLYYHTKRMFYQCIVVQILVTREIPLYSLDYQGPEKLHYLLIQIET